METRRCPMCGQPNPPDAEKCRYCDARIKPLWEEKGEEIENVDYFPSSNNQDQEIPEWLRSLRSGGEESQHEPRDTLPSFEFEAEERLDKEQWVPSEEMQPEEFKHELPFVQPFEIESVPDESSVESLLETPPEEIPEKAEDAPVKEQVEEYEEAEFPKWLEALPGQEWEDWSESDEEAKVSDELEGAIPPFISLDESLLEEATPEWLQEDVESKIVAPVEPSVPPFIETEEGELPEWLKSIGVDEAPDKPSSIPSLKVELAGPLYGLKDILPAEPLMAEQKAPSSVLSKLIVTEQQQAQADLFLQMISQEGTPKPIKQEGVVKPLAVWRATIFIILLAAAVIGILFNPFPSQPAELDVGVFDTMHLISQLPAKAATLVIVDYEIGDFAEMQSVSYGILDQLMIKGAYLVFVSTQPNGTLQADRLIRDVNRISGHKYKEMSDYINLGYIPGGAIGMQMFARSPRAIFPYAVDGQAAWQSPSLKPVQQLSDFSLVLLLSENPSRARNWVEQIQGLVDPTRLVLAVSAQTEPVMRAYYESNPRQVQGFVSGLRGGAVYEIQTGRSGLASQLWNGFSFTVTIAVVLIGIGSLFNMAVSFLKFASGGKGKKR